MNITAKGRTWATRAAAAACLAGSASLGLIWATGGSSPTLRETLDHIAAEANRGNLGPAYAADPDCDDTPAEKRTGIPVGGITITVESASESGTTGRAALSILTGPGAYDSQTAASRWIKADGEWRESPDGAC